jgi:hypothetical protein
VASQFTRLTRLSLTQAGNIGGVWLIDKLWGNVPVVTTTTSQAITSPTWPARDQTASTAGSKVYLALETSSTTGNAGAITNTTVSYTNSAGTAGRTATLSSYPITALTGTWQMFSLAAGDDGVRSVQSITLGTSYASGAIHLVAFRLVADLATPLANVANAPGSPTSACHRCGTAPSCSSSTGPPAPRWVRSPAPAPSRRADLPSPGKALAVWDAPLFDIDDMIGRVDVPGAAADELIDDYVFGRRCTRRW